MNDDIRIGPRASYFALGFAQTVSKAEEELGRKITEELDRMIMESLFKPRKPGVK